MVAGLLGESRNANTRGVADARLASARFSCTSTLEDYGGCVSVCERGLVASLGSGVSCDRGSVHMKKKMTKSSVSDRLLLVRCSVAREKSHYPQVATVGGKRHPGCAATPGGRLKTVRKQG